MDDPKGGQTRNELVSFDMPALPHTSSSAGRFSGQVAMPAQLMNNKEALNLLMSAGTCSGVGVAVCLAGSTRSVSHFHSHHASTLQCGALTVPVLPLLSRLHR